MNFLRNKKKLEPLKIDNHNKVNNSAFDGKNYYYTVKCKNIIVKTDSKHCLEIPIKTYREYNALVFDTIENCFWATSKNDYNSVFKLDCSLEEIDIINVTLDLEVKGNITSLSFNCKCNSIYISYPNCLIEMRKNGKYKVKFYDDNAYITNVFSLYPHYFVCILNDYNKSQIVYEFNNNNRLVKEYVLPQGIEIGSNSNYTIKNIIFTPKSSESGEWYIDILYIKDCDYTFKETINITKESLGYTPNDCNFNIIESGCNTCIDDTVSGFISSISRVENSVAEILNSESNKINYAIEKDADIETMLCINKSVTKTIAQVTHLEQVLHNILDSLCEQGFCIEDNCSS